MKIFENSRMVLSNLLEDIKKIWFISLCVVQSIFLLFYSYSIYKNINKTIFLVIYSVLFFISFVTFISILVSHIKNKKTTTAFARVKNILKYLANLTMIIVSVFEMIKFGSSDLNKILLIVSTISLLIQILIELIKVFADVYISAFDIALHKDTEWFEIFDKNKAPGKILEAINKPLEKIAGIEREHKVTPEEKILNKHKQKYTERQEKVEEAKFIKKLDKKLEAEKEGKLKVRSELNKLKNTVAHILTKDNDSNDEEAN